jgi:hypothetical protein
MVSTEKRKDQAIATACAAMRGLTAFFRFKEDDLKFRDLSAGIVFAVVGFWPLGLYVFCLISLFSSAARRARVFAAHGDQEFATLATIDPLLYSLPPIAIAMVLVLVAYLFFRRAESWGKKRQVVYRAWVLIAFSIGYLFSMAMGSVSMATVEGVAGFTRFIDYAPLALIFTGAAHILLLPWLAIVMFLLERVNKRFKLWGDLHPALAEQRPDARSA